MFDIQFLNILINSALIVTGIAVLVLVGLLLKDVINKQVW